MLAPNEIACRMSDQKIALVTGASRGLGAGFAEALAATHHVIAVARTTGALEELDDRIQALGGSTTLAQMDVTKPDAMAHLCRSIYDRWGQIDLWVHAAVHAAPLAPADHVDAKDLAKSFDLNVTSTASLITMIAPLLQSDGAQAVFFEDSHEGEKFFAAYGASKAAQIAIVRAWAAESARRGPDVRILSPKPMPTATRARFFPGENRDNLVDPRTEAQRLLRQI